jgi:hypothetical protein
MLYDLSLRQNLNADNVHLVIHPFYTTIADKKPNNRYATQGYLDTISNFIKENLEKNAKIIVFQEASKIETLNSQLSVFNDYEIWYVQTVTGEATPIFKNGWKQFSEIIIKNDITSVTISGLFLVNKSISDTLKDYEEKYDRECTLPEFIRNREQYIQKFPIARKWLKMNFVPTGCVGFAIMNLLKYGIDVDISKQTSPCSKYEIL